MQQSNQPPKFVIPFAQNDPAKAVIPATSPDDTRASQALGFPPRTGLPPEAGGVPPQKADMNGALNQLAGPILWALAGGRFPFDNTFASDANVGGYPLGADLLAADARGSWISTANDNTANPDTTGTGWVPGYHYGATALTGQTGGTVTLSPAQAAKRVITIAGTLTSNLVLIVPAWVYSWTFYNNTSGAFSVSVRTASSAAVVLPQNTLATPVQGDGVSISLANTNLSTGRLLNVQRFTASGSYNPTLGTRRIVVELLAGGGGGGGVGATTATSQQAGGGGGGGAYVKFLTDLPGGPVPVTIGSGGTGGPAVDNSSGGTGGNSSFGSLATVSGGLGGQSLVNNSGGAAAVVLGGGSGVPAFSGSAAPLVVVEGSRGGYGFVLGGVSNNNNAGGAGGPSALGLNSRLDPSSAPPANAGVGGCGARAAASAPAQAGGAGSSGLCIVWEYS